jgi:hypothetical protein
MNHPQADKDGGRINALKIARRRGLKAAAIGCIVFFGMAVLGFMKVGRSSPEVPLIYFGGFYRF